MSQTMHETPVNIATTSNFPTPVSSTMSNISLTSGCLERICKSDRVEKPVLQVIQIKPGNTPQNGNPDDETPQPNQRYRLILSDGLYYQHATLTTQVNALVSQGRLKKSSVIELVQYTTNTVKSKIIIVIVSLNVIAENSPKIGNPQNVDLVLTPRNGGEEEEEAKINMPLPPLPSHQNTTNDVPMEEKHEPQAHNVKNEEQDDTAFQPKKEIKQLPPQRQQQQQQQPQRKVNGPSFSVNQPKASSSKSDESGAFSNAPNMNSFRPHRQPMKGSVPDRSSRIIPFGSKPTQQTRNVSSFTDDQVGIFPIEALNPFQNKWKIRARVIAKGEIRNWNSDRGSGKLFSVDLADESGEIRATAFNQAVDKIYDFIEVNKVYYICKAAVKTANKKYSSIKNDYEMQFSTETEIIPCDDDVPVPVAKYHFIPIEKIEECEVGSTIDVIGVAINVEGLTQLTTKNMREVSKRAITLMDETGSSIKATLWGATAENFDGSLENPVVLIKAIKVGDFGGKSLSSSPSSIVLVNPDIDEAHKLKGWHQKVQNTIQPKSLTNSTTSAANYPRKFISSISNEGLGNGGEKADFFSVKATIMSIPKEGNIAYPACIGEKCGRKVSKDPRTDKWFCEKCNVEFPECEYKYTLSLSLFDMSGQTWTRAYGGVGDIIMCVKAGELVEWKNEQKPYYDYVVQEALIRDYVFNLRAKTEIYEEVPKVSITVSTAIPLDYAAESKKLLKEIRNLSLS